MNMTYRSKKQVTRMMARCSQGVAKVYPRCTQGVAILMSKLRSSLGAAWEQPRSSLEYAYSEIMTTFLRPFSSKRAELERRLASDGITARPSRDYGSSLTRLRLVMSLLLMLTLGSGSVWGQSPVEITTDTNGNDIIDDNEKKFYLIQTNAFPSFYIAPQANNNITTNNILGDYMLWYFLDAGKDNPGTENEIQYYYIVNNSTGKYICNTSDRLIQIVSLSDANKEKCKFKLVVDNEGGTTGFYNIDVKANQTNFGLNKQSGSANESNSIRLTSNDYIHDSNSKWKFVPFNGTYVWPTRPFNPSTDSDKHFYKISNVNSGGFYVSTDATPDKVTYASTETDRMVWYLKEAPNDPSEPWYKYYYIINPSTGGRYMYYNGTATNGSNQTDAVSVKEYNSENEDRYQFAVIQAARGDGSSRVTCYAIIPKLLKDQLWKSNSIGSTSVSNGANMGIIKSRGATNAQWKFEVTDYSTECANPTITYSNTTGKVTITTTTSNPSIYYTTNGTEPSSTNGTLYSGPFDVTEETTIKAIVTRPGFTDSEVTTKTIYKVATPTIQDNGNYAVSITSETEGATIYYTTNGSNPTTSTTEYTAPLTENISGVTIKALAVKDGMINSAIGSGAVTLSCATPVFTKSGDYISISCPFPSSGVVIYYTTNGDEPTSSSTPYTSPIPVVIGDVIKAIAVATGYNNSEVATKTIHNELTPTGGKYLITSQTDFEVFVDMASTIEGATYHYVLQTNVDAGSAITIPFTGTFDGGGYTISGLSHPLFNTVDGGVVKNVMLKGVQISGSGNVGAIAGEASGYTRIYNCGILPSDNKYENESSYVSSSDGNCGGLVGLLNDDSRVINCFSYANITGGETVAGIVGYNNFASTAEVSDGKYSKLKTAVVNCMFYGNITGGTTRYPVYGGNLITNANETGISSYNYYRAEANLGLADNNHYNCSFPADERYLTQVEFHRSLLNSNRELCGWWVGSDVTPSTLTTDEVQAIPKDASLMYKWVVDPNVAPYPILKPFGKYASVINGNTGTPWVNRATANPYEGKQLGTLSVTVNSGSHSSAASQILSIPITDMDTLRYDFGYRKIQLPYYNTVFGNPEADTWAEKYANNYTDQVVTGWKITNVTTDGTVQTYNSFVADWQDGYNFADRKSIDKDIYSSTNPRVFAQGGNYYVPDGVSSITIEAYWGDAIYVRNDGNYYDRVNITAGNTGSPFAPAGTRGTLDNGKTVFTTKIRDVIDNIKQKKSVYDYAIVLVGNVQESNGNNAVTVSGDNNTRGFTIMSADFDFDEEPDYCLEWQLGTGTARNTIAPIRFDFLPVVELGIAGKLHNSQNFFSLGCFRSFGHFEVTETAFIRFGQFEFELPTRDIGPIILNGGIFDQYTRGRNNETNQHINYVIVGGHLVMPSFTPGAHVGQNYQTRHCAVNALGGDFSSFYLTGGYNENVNPYDDNPHCYIDGGRFGTVAAAYKEGIKGNVTWRINHALIREFYGGGVMSDDNKVVKGNIDVVIDNSIVGKYCGGPKFGDMAEGKTVTTSATGTTFNQYFGAGNGGTNYVQYANTDKVEAPISNWSTTINNNYHIGQYRSKAQGYEANYDYEVINTSAGTDNNSVVDRSYYYSAQFATTNTGNVTSTLTDCTIKTNFYGGGFLGGVTGNVNSTLNNCKVTGSVFGAGYSASAGTVTISNKDKTPPVANTYTGMIKPQTGGTSTTYYWTHDAGTTSEPVTTGEDEKKYFYTEIPLDNLGTVSGNVTLTINGNTTVGESIYGGGEESVVNGNTTVTVTGGTIGTTGKGEATWGNVYGGGKGKDDDVDAGLVKGNTTINISQAENQTTTIIHNVYGGGAFGSVGTFTYDGTTGLPNGLTENTGTANITITGGTFGSDGKENGMIFGSSRGSEGDPKSDDYVDKIAWVGNTNVVIGTQNAESNANPWIKGSVYGGGENGHNYQNGHVTVHSGTIGITDSSVDGGARYSTRGNVYGGGCGTDTYSKDGKKYYNFNAGIVMGNTQIDIDGGHIVHNVYGGGAMGTVGTYTLDTDGTNDIQDGMPLSCAEHTGLCTIKITGGKIGMTNATMTGHGNDGPDDFGHIFGAGRGYSKDPNVYPNIESCAFFNNTDLTIGGTALVCGSVFGGSESGHVMNNTNVTISGGQIGCGEGRTAAYTDSDFASESLSTTNHWTYTAAGMGAPHDQYANMSGTYDYTGDFAYIPEADRKATSEGGLPVATDGRTFYGNVFAGGSGYYPYAPGLWLRSAGHIGGTASVTVSGGHILNNLYGGCEMADIDGAVTVTMTGGTIGVPRTSAQIKANPNSGNIYGAGMGDKRIFFNTSTNVASATVDISNGTVYGAVYGGGEDGHVMGNVTTTISQPAEKTTVIGCDGQSGYDGNVFGAGQGHIGALTAGVVGGNAILSITGGTLNGSAYGGGRIASVGTNFAMATIDDPNNPGQKIPNPLYGKMQDGDDHGCLTVSLTGGTIEQNVYGGCMGTTANVLYGESKNVLVELNKDKTATDRGCAVKGDIFGCNNVNSTPQGDVEVHVYATQNAAATQIANTPAVAASETTPAVAAVEDAKVKYRYDVRAVYGGGNLATYNPVTPYDGTSGSKTKVIIEGCALTSIETVYGGGNAAAVPETDVTIKSAYEIGYLFGGGNGKDDIAQGVPNPGADVGTLDHGSTTYGRGNANTLMEGGLIHEAYGGSNTKGIIKGSINQITDPKDPSVDPDCCVLEVEKIVGAGKYADIDGDVNMTLSCQPDRKVNLLFAGADEANVNGNITLNITNGHFGKVFGGNNLGGAIKGKITVKVEETGCQPIKIDDLYLGGNEAAYSVFGYYESEDPVTGKNILKPRTSATDPNLPVKLDGTSYTSINQFTNYAQPELNIISCTYIGNVFGGGFGEGAVMYADPTVNVNMEPGQYAETAVPAMMTELGLNVTKTAPNPDKLGIIRNVFGGGDAANVAGNTTVNIATEANKSAYIIGSVFGGGNAADVLGNTNVTMSGGYVFNGIFGGGYAGNVGTFTRSTAAADVNIYEHTAHTGCIGKPVSCATGTGKCTVVVNGGQIGPISVATEGMKRKDEDGKGIPVPEGWVWGAGQGLVEDPAEHPDTHFTSYVGSTDVTIGGTALIMESIIGGGEFGRVLGDTKVTIQDHCQIGVGEGMVDANNKPIRYTDGYDYGAGATTNQFVNPLTTTITNSNALAECSHYPYGRDTNSDGKPDTFLPYDPYYEVYPTYVAAHTDLGPASTSNPSDGKTWIGCVFAGGSGYMPYLKKDGSGNPIGYDWCPSAGLVEGDTELRISGGHILTNVYGGNEITDVKGKSIVKMTGGTIGVPRTLEQIVKHPLTCYLFGAGKGDERSRFYNYTNTGSVEVEISGGIIYGSVFGGSEDGHVTGDIDLTIRKGDDFTIGSTTYTNGPIIGTWGTSYVDGNVFGGGRGFSGNTLTAGNVGGNVTMNISGGNILGSVYGGGRLASVGTYLVETTDGNYGKQIPDNGNEKHGHITINISGGTIGNDKEYIYNPTAEQKAAIPNTTFDYQNHLQYTKGGNVFTAGMGRLYALDNKTVLSQWQKLGQCKQTVLNMTGGTVKSSVYGGGEIGIVAQSATVNIDGGTVGTKIVNPGDATQYYNFGSVFGGGKGSTANVEGISEAGTTQGNVEVHLNKTVASNDDAKGAIVHQVFGCNDMNGSPKGTVTVHVYATQNADKANISSKPDKDTDTYDVMAVYGGGNLAAYEPTDLSTGKTNVIIDGCRLTSIRQVYGGGNAASTPATNVEVNGTYEILELFGGGNGYDKLPDGKPNPGANVGYKNYTIYENVAEEWVAKDDPAYDTKEERIAGNSAIVYGTGQASINVYGGTVHRVFGGSNTKGNVRQTAVTLLDENSGCEFCVDEAYGGGKSAPMDAEAKLLMACIPGLRAAYGGAEAAAIKGNVTLNITNGTFDRVFGGNNLSGTIDGSITVNIEEIGCRPIKIGELYGGGNLAGYSVNGYNDDGTPKESGPKLYEDPQVNVMSFTSIGKVFGGGFGSGATMVGNPTVNVNEVYGRYYNDDRSIVAEGTETPNHYPIPSHAKGKMGAIHTVFGGGNAAKVMGNTTVNIATQAEVYIVKEVTAGAALPEGCYTRSGAGTTADPFVYTTATGTASADVTYYEKKDVLGVDIRGNVYGGGNNAEVTGNTNVNIGKKAE